MLTYPYNVLIGNEIALNKEMLRKFIILVIVIKQQYLQI